MKIIKPEITISPVIKKEEIKQIIIEHKQADLVDDSTTGKEPKSIEDVMDSVLQTDLNVITFNITLTKRQYEIWQKKGGLKWLKKKLTGQR